MSQNRDCYVTSGYRDDKPCKYIADAEPGYVWIKDDLGKRVVPVDQIIWKDKDNADDLL